MDTVEPNRGLPWTYDEGLGVTLPESNQAAKVRVMTKTHKGMLKAGVKTNTHVPRLTLAPAQILMSTGAPPCGQEGSSTPILLVSYPHGLVARLTSSSQ